MSRFNRLEFEPSRKPPADAPSAEPQARRITPDPDHDEHHWLKLAEAQRRLGQYENALRFYSRALEWDKSVVSGWVGQVRMLIALEEYPEAELWARKALELFKNNADLLAGRAQALSRLAKMKDALGSSDASINQPGHGSYPWLVRGELMLARGEKTADYCFGKAMQMDGDWLLLLEIGQTHLHYGHAASGLEPTRRAVQRAPDQVLAWYCQGQCEAALGLSDAATVSFERCLDLLPDYADARIALEQLSRAKPVRGFLKTWFGLK
ncbi:MAG TPA: hypothetical protein VFE47_07260 [Tepidisphaeraceae bacterium]|jgi:tetratricopeptide (TPR) repeat protein|nr:hypothetical protein [Tepidisphaeraceae bacterium]